MQGQGIVGFLISAELQIYPKNFPVKKFLNRLIFDRIMVMSLWPGFWPTLYNAYCILGCGCSKTRTASARLVFTARCYASAVLAMGLCLSVCVCPSVTSQSSTKTAKRRITQITPHDTPVSLVFWRQRSLRNSTGVIPYKGAECRWPQQSTHTKIRTP